jgi:hypothetical protein
MDILVQIAPQCPVCHAQHIQSLTQEGLREQLKKRLLELYCPRFYKRWPAAAEQRETPLRAVGRSWRKSEETAAASWRA